ncbi:unannotated protein [freshwater metagenome]|uniref:Unannotated protein n=1 Tax=freshwater metagenome TaxID=449393 RepID=A0A6J7IGV9_9ZZZZ
MQRVGEGVEPGTEFVDLGAGPRQTLAAEPALLGQLVAGTRGDGHGVGQPRGDEPCRLLHCRSHSRGVLAGLPGALRAQPGLAFSGGGPAQRLGAAAHGVRAFLGGAHGEPGLDLDGPCHVRGCGRLVPVDGFGFHRGRLLRVVQPGLQLGQLFERPIAAGLQLAALTDQSLPFLVGDAGFLAEPAQLLVDRRDRRIGLVECGQRLLGSVLAGLLLCLRTGQRGGEFTHLPLGPFEVGLGLVDLGRDLERARLPVGSAADPARADDVAVGGHGVQPGPFGDELLGGGQVLDDDDVAEQRGERSAQSRRRVDEVERPRRTRGQVAAALGAGVLGPVAEDERRPTAVAVLERGHGRTGGAEVVGRHRVGGRAEDRGDGHLVAGPHPDQFGHRAEQACAVVVLAEPGGSVAPVETDGECVDPRAQ